MTLPATIRVIVRVPFPALVQGAAFITVAKANGIWTLTPNYQLFAPAPSIKPTQLVAVFDTATGIWNTVNATQVAASAVPLAGLSDVQVTEGAGINGFSLTWNSSISKWVASATVATLAGLTDVQVAEGSGINGFSLIWSSAISKWVASGTANGVVGSIAALQAITGAAGNVVTLNAGLLSGPFAWSTANLSTQVTNDPGKGITVPPSSDTTGASGAWVRQYSGPAQITWFGVIADGVLTLPPAFSGPPTVVSGTDNSQALANWGTWARAQSALGLRVIMEVTPPAAGFNAYLFDHSKCLYFNIGIKYLRWRNNGALWQNINTGASTFSNPWGVAALGLRNTATNVPLAWKINQTTPGSFAFSMLTPSDASNLNVKDHVMLASLDIEYFGYPPAMQQYDFVRISAITQYAAANATSVTYDTNAGTLTVTFAAAPFGAGIGNLLNGVYVPISGLTGSGTASLNATWPILNTQTSGTVINFRVPRGLGSLTIGGGTLAATAIITIEQSIRYAHLPTFPDDGVFPAIYPAGAGRVWQLNAGPATVNGVSVPVITWDIDHEYYDMHLGFPFVQYQAWPMTGRRIVDVDSVVGGYTESDAGVVNHIRPTILGGCEPDKNVGEISYEYPMMYNPGIAPTAPSGALGFASPIERVSITGGRFNGGLNTGQVKQLNCRLVNISSLAIFAAFGLSNRHVFDTCEIGNSDVGGIPLQLSAIDGATLQTIDGTNVAYGTAGAGASSAAGVLTVLKSAFPSGVGAWNAVPGMTVNLTGPSNLFTGASSNQVHGNGIVTSVFEDATYYYIATTLPFATLPAWSNSKIYLFHNQGAIFKDCTGSDVIRQASEAYRKGKDYWEYKDYILGGAGYTTNQNFSFSSQTYGALTQVVCTVLAPGSNVGAAITVSMGSFNSASNFVADAGTLLVKFVVGIFGQRTVTLAAFTGAQTGDGVAFNGGSSSVQALPPGRVVNSVLGISTSGFAGTAAGNPVALIELFFDCGIIRKVIPVQYDNQGNTNDVIFGITGPLP